MNDELGELYWLAHYRELWACTEHAQSNKPIRLHSEENTIVLRAMELETGGTISHTAHAFLGNPHHSKIPPSFPPQGTYLDR